MAVDGNCKGYNERARELRQRIESLLGGVEYGERIVQSIDDWYRISEKDVGMEHFLKDLRGSLRSLKE